MIYDRVLNQSEVLPLVYRDISIPHMLGLLGSSDHNLLLIGTQ